MDGGSVCVVSHKVRGCPHVMYRCLPTYERGGATCKPAFPFSCVALPAVAAGGSTRFVGATGRVRSGPARNLHPLRRSSFHPTADAERAPGRLGRGPLTKTRTRAILGGSLTPRTPHKRPRPGAPVGRASRQAIDLAP
jgi:hypothetical protein